MTSQDGNNNRHNGGQKGPRNNPGPGQANSRRPDHRRRHRGGSAPKGQEQTPHGAQERPGQRPAGRFQHKRPFRGQQRPPGTGRPPEQRKEDGLIRKYQHLLDQHLHARRKYFEKFYSEDEFLRKKLERTFFSSIEELRRYELYLSPEEKEILKKYIDPYREEHTYAMNHGLSPQNYPVDESLEIRDPHLLEKQKEANFKSDTEESIGTLDDYKSYKGIP